MISTHLRRWAPAGLLAGAAALYLIGLGKVGLYDLDEAVYAEISREMVAVHHWATPRLDFVPYLEKPPLLYWLNSLAYEALGVSAFSARLVTALAAVAGVGCVYGLGRDLWGRRAGLASGAVLATSFGYFIFARMAMPDMLFTSLVTACFWGLGRALAGGQPARGAAIGAWAAMAGAVLAKGLIGLVFPALVVGAFVLATWDWAALRRLEWVRGGILFLILAAPWHALMAWKYPGFLWFYFVNEHVARFLGHRELQNYVSLPIPTFLGITLAWFFPWCLFLPAALWRCWPRAGSIWIPGQLPSYAAEQARSSRGCLFVLLWAGGVIGFFIASSSRLEYYALPALPALALCVGRLWDAESAGEGGRHPWLLRLTWGGMLAAALALIPATLLFPRIDHMQFYNLFPAKNLSAADPAAGKAEIYDVPSFARVVPVLEAAAGLIAAGAAAGAVAWFGRRPRAAVACLALGAAAGLGATERGFALFAPYGSVAQLAGVLRAHLRPGDKLVLEGPYERHAGLGFYTGRTVRMLRGDRGVLVYGSQYANPREVFLSDAEFERLWKGPDRVYLLCEGADSPTELRSLTPGAVVIGRTGGNWLLANGK